MVLERPDGSFAILVDDQADGGGSSHPAASIPSDHIRPGALHGVLAPNRFGIRDERPVPPTPQGVADEELAAGLTMTSDVLWRPDGTRRSPKDAARFVGWRAVWIAQLNEALAEQLSRPPAISSPPGVFLSYRWGKPEENAWVEALRADLVGRGYPTLLDRDVPPEEVDVPSFVARIAECRYFLAVVDPGYVERLGTPERSSIKDGWVYDEVQTARLLGQDNRLRTIGLLRDDTVLPDGFAHPEVGRMGNIIDVCTPGQLRQFLDDVFPPLQHRPRPADVAAARQALIDSERRLARGEYGDARKEAVAASKFLPAAPDGHAQQLRVALEAGDVPGGLVAADQLLRLLPDSAEVLLAAALLSYDAGRRDDAVRLAAHLRSSPDATGPERALGQYLLGTALDDVGQSYAGRAHLAIAVQLLPEMAQAHNDLGITCRRLGWFGEAITRLRTGLDRVPGDANLLRSLIGTAVEADQPDVALEAIAAYIHHHPDASDVDYLSKGADALAAAPRSGALRSRVHDGDLDGWVGCSSCATVVPLRGEAAMLCGACGSCVDGEPHCPHCGADGRVPLGLVASGLPIQCPYCGTGRLVSRTGGYGVPTPGGG